MASSGGSLGGRVVMTIVVVLGLTTAGSWVGRSPDRSTADSISGKATRSVERREQPADGPTIEPTPIMRPLALIANAIGPDPLILLDQPEKPTLAPSYADAIVPGPSSPCAPLKPNDAAKGGAWDSPFRNWRLQDAECALITRVRDKATAAGFTVSVVVATLPDWVDSSLQWTFDPTLDAIQTSAAQMGYVLSGFDLADTEPDPAVVQPKGSVWPFPHVHERTPGSLLFRRPAVATDADLTPDPGHRQVPRYELLLVLLIGETPTAGVHAPALATALDLALAWQRPGEAVIEPGDDQAASPALQHALALRQDAVRILGPTYSGSALSLSTALRDAAARHGLASTGGAWFNLVTGSASGEANIPLLEVAGLSGFRATTRSDTDVLKALARFLGRSDRGWACGRHVALLVEANTTWGSQFFPREGEDGDKERQCSLCSGNQELYNQNGTTYPDPTLKNKDRRLDSDPLPCATVTPFPLHISRLRSEVARTGSGAAKPLPQSSEVALDLGEKLPPVDRVPPETPELTAATVEIMESGMFRSVEDRRLTAIGILATDKRDHVYLAEEIARRRPNVLPFTIESSLVYLHPDVGGFVRGTVVASTYSLNERTQRLTQPWLAEHFTQQFGASPSHGAFNALAVLLNEQRQLIDYRAPRRPGLIHEPPLSSGPCRTAGTTDIDCLPPVWISVVGRGAILPLAADTQGACREAGDGKDLGGYALCLRERSHPPVAKPGMRVQGGDAYLAARHLLLWDLLGLLAVLIGYQVWVQRRIDAWPNAATPAAQMSMRDVGGAVLDWLCDLIARPKFGDARAAARKASVTSAAVRAATFAAAAERNASVVAMRGASLALALWLLKLAAIYWADATGASLGWIHDVYLGLVVIVGLYVVVQIRGTFWFYDTERGRSTWVSNAVFLYVALFAAYLLVPYARPSATSIVGWVRGAAVVVAFLSAFGDFSQQHATQIDAVTRWRRLPVLIGLSGFLALSCDLALAHWQPVEALLYADRTAMLGSLVSPATCIVLICSAIFWWGTWNLRRVELLLLPEIEVGVGPLLATRARQVALDSRLAFREPALTIGAFMLAPSAVALIALFYGSANVHSIDGRFFSMFLLLGSTAVVTIIAHTLAHSSHLGAAIVRLLHGLARHPGVATFRALGKESFPWRMSYREPRIPDLEPLVRRIRAIECDLAHWGPDDYELVDRRPAYGRILAQHVHSALSQVDEVHRGKMGDVTAQHDEWLALNRLAYRFNSLLDTTKWHYGFSCRSGSEALRQALDDMEYVVFFHGSVVLRDLLTRLVSGFTTVIGGLAMLLAAHLLYTFQGRVFWLTFDAIAMAAAAAITSRLLIVLERDTVLSSLWQTAPGKISLFGGLTWRMLGYLLISLGTLFAVFFPELAGRLVDWIVPVRSALE